MMSVLQPYQPIFEILKRNPDLKQLLPSLVDAEEINSQADRYPENSDCISWLQELYQNQESRI